MADRSDAVVTQTVADLAQPLSTAPSAYDGLLDIVGDARFILLGEASHGTHEFYRERAEITKRLIQEKGVTAVAVEADWPDAYRVNCYVRGAGDDASAVEALMGFRRFPQWMWRNTDVVAYEAIFHSTRLARFLLPMPEGSDAALALRSPRLERAIGVIYRPDTERASHYFMTCLPRQFDAVIHLDETHAVDPLDRTAHWEAGEVPETYPFAV